MQPLLYYYTWHALLPQLAASAISTLYTCARQTTPSTPTTIPELTRLYMLTDFCSFSFHRARVRCGRIAGKREEVRERERERERNKNETYHCICTYPRLYHFCAKRLSLTPEFANILISLFEIEQRERMPRCIRLSIIFTSISGILPTICCNFIRSPNKSRATLLFYTFDRHITFKNVHRLFF